MPREAALRRVHGTGALFSAAYGNVGSSIYYALGLVALYALGLTPVTFMIAGLIFAFTAASYVEATVLYPEAGGSSSFARHAFNELASFLAAWAQMLTYIVTVAISAFFVPHYLAVFWEPLGHGPGDVIFGVGLIVALALLNIKGTEESARLNLVLAIADLLTQIVLVGIGLILVFDADLLVEPDRPRGGADAGATSRSGSRWGWSPIRASRRSRTWRRRRRTPTARSHAVLATWCLRLWGCTRCCRRSRYRRCR